MNEKPLKENTENAVKAFRNFLETIHTLRAPGGCPWDREQTPKSLRTTIIEECFEAVDAITSGDSSHAKEELGDVFLNAAMISYMYEQNEDFSIADVLNEVSEKLVRRHPHVWPESKGASEAIGKAGTAGEVINQWERIKEKVEGRKTGAVLDEVPEGFPPMLKAYKMQKKAAKKGFDWPDAEDALKKVEEELAESKEACFEVSGGEPFTLKSSESQNEAQLHLEEEIGDLLFAVINWGRKLGVEPDTALSRANKKFYNRFGYVEKKLEEGGKELKESSLEKMLDAWNEAKNQIK